MTTGEQLVSLSGATSGTALAHLLAITTGSGSGETVFSGTVRVVTSTPEVFAQRITRRKPVEQTRVSGSSKGTFVLSCVKPSAGDFTIMKTVVSQDKNSAVFVSPENNKNIFVLEQNIANTFVTTNRSNNFVKP